MNELVVKAIKDTDQSHISFCKFISANDAGATGAHQAGFYIPYNSYQLLFDKPGQKGENKEKFIKILWHNDFATESRIIYYGKGTRNEYRITRFGRGFPFLNDDNMGSLLILNKKKDDYYTGFVLGHDEDIDDFLQAYGMSPTDTNSLIQEAATESYDSLLYYHIRKYLKIIGKSFPSTFDISTQSRFIYVASLKLDEPNYINRIITSPDKELLNWIELEYLLFKEIEKKVYNHYISEPISSVDSLIRIANTILNRRKSRAGKSLEHHLAEIFIKNDLHFTEQGKTEGNKKPDFIFPEIDYYFNPDFRDKLVFLGVKTTRKDRWRQILSEADNISTKHLFTLQQGISSNQLKEMKEHNVRIVVPKDYFLSFPEEHREDLFSLINFIDYTRKKSAF